MRLILWRVCFCVYRVVCVDGDGGCGERGEFLCCFSNIYVCVCILMNGGEEGSIWRGYVYYLFLFPQQTIVEGCPLSRLSPALRSRVLDV